MPYACQRLRRSARPRVAVLSPFAGHHADELACGPGPPLAPSPLCSPDDVDADDFRRLRRTPEFMLLVISSRLGAGATFFMLSLSPSAVDEVKRRAGERVPGWG